MHTRDDLKAITGILGALIFENSFYLSCKTKSKT